MATNCAERAWARLVFAAALLLRAQRPYSLATLNSFVKGLQETYVSSSSHPRKRSPYISLCATCTFSSCSLCLVALPAGIIMAIPAVLVLVYIRCIRNRIEFAAAHLQVGSIPSMCSRLLMRPSSS